MRPLEFGWYLPTHGDTTAYGLMEAQIAGSPELCDRVVKAAEDAGFEYLLIPVGSVCWEAWISGAFMAARSARIKPLIAARPGYINPVLMAKMISTFDQMSGGRICINLIAGQNESEVEAEGVRYAKEERYALMEEEVSILKALWTTRGPVNFQGKFHTHLGRAYPAASAAAAVSKILSRRRLAAGLGGVGEAFRRSSVLGRSAGAHRGEYRRDPADGAGA
ncbi:alkanesulfonate monooxygenase SsuD/methylene tetrahydromethanopterin reductase-like flavin-dependent oxidoreductase (luciferase family) [Bradyrhizobium sp. JR6.1]